MVVEQRLGGKGLLKGLDGQLAFPCTFELQHLASGICILQCVHDSKPAACMLKEGKIDAFEGTTDSGQRIVSAGELRVFQLFGPEVIFTLNGAVIGHTTTRCPRHLFRLTNFRFPRASSFAPVEPVHLRVNSGQELDLTLVPDDAYDEKNRYIRTTKSIAVTATLVLANSATLANDGVRETADNICYALSVLQGNKINWIVWHAATADGDVQWAEFGQRVTKPFTALPLNWKRANHELVPLAALPVCLSRLQKLRTRYARILSVVDTWLDARYETDFLHARALKFAVVLESLRDIILTADTTYATTWLTEPKWTQTVALFLPELRKILTTGVNAPQEVVNILCEPTKWQGFNRKSFRSDLNAAFKRLGVHEVAADLDLVIRIRNKLIHEGRFLCEADPSVLQAFKDGKTDEFLFLAAFVDRVVMQAFGLEQYLTLADRRPRT
jgi:hypothetical protein